MSDTTTTATTPGADAIGVRIFEFPITPEKVIRALKRKAAAEPKPAS